MRVGEVMSTRVKTVATTVRAQDAWELMRGERIHHLVVTDGRRIAGIVSARDVGGPRGAAARAGHQIGELMTINVVTVVPDTPVKKVANLMRGRTIGCVVVIDGKQRAIGIVTTSDLLELLGRGAIRPSPVSKRPALNYRVPHRKLHRAYGAW